MTGHFSNISRALSFMTTVKITTTSAEKKFLKIKNYEKLFTDYCGLRAILKLRHYFN